MFCSTVLGSPRLGELTETYGQVIIRQNDIPNGQLELSVDMVTVPEDFAGTLVRVVRGAGAFGAVSITLVWKVVSMSKTFNISVALTSCILFPRSR